jgi:hypothetical protein
MGNLKRRWQVILFATFLRSGDLKLWYSGKPSCILQEVEVPVLSNDDCTTKTNYTSKMITNNMMCAGYPGVGQRDSCQGLLINKSTFFPSLKFSSFTVPFTSLAIPLNRRFWLVMIYSCPIQSIVINCAFSRWSTPGWARRQTVRNHRNRFVGKWVSIAYNVRSQSPSLRLIVSIQFSVALDPTIPVCNRQNVNDCDGNFQFSQTILFSSGVYTRVTRYLGMSNRGSIISLDNQFPPSIDWIHENSKDGCFCNE